MLEKLTQWSLVKYIGSLFSPEVLGKRLAKIMELYNTNSFGLAAKRLFIWCIVIIVVSTIIDQSFYWSRPEQRIRLERYIHNTKKYLKILSNKINSVFHRQRG